MNDLPDANHMTGSRLVPLIAVLVCLVALVYSLVSGAEAALGYDVTTAMLAVSFLGLSAIGAAVVIKGVAARVGWALISVGTTGSLFVAGEKLALTLSDDGLSSAAKSVSSVGGVMFALFLLGLALLFLIFPTGKVASRAWRFAVWLAVVVNFVLIVSSLMALQYVDDIGSFLRSNWDYRQFGEAISPGLVLVSELSTIAAGAIVAAGAVSLILRLRTSSGVERQQVKWVVYAGLLAALGWILALSFLLPPAIEIIPAGIGALALTAGLAVSLFHYRLYEIDRIISRTVSYTVVIAVLGALYFGMITMISSLVPSGSSLAVAASTIAAAALFNPLRKRIQHAVDRRFNRSGYQVELIFDEFESKLQGSLEIEELATVWNQTVTEALQPDSSGLWLNPTLIDQSSMRPDHPDLDA